LRPPRGGRERDGVRERRERRKLARPAHGLVGDLPADLRDDPLAERPAVRDERRLVPVDAPGDLNYTDRRGAARTAVVGTLRAGSSWSLTPQIMFLSHVAPVVGGHGQTWVSFTFKPTSGGAWQVDDFYVDPIKSQ
jgi:hypothetical protein